jgi:L-amino acid N-acyltransferase
MLIRPANDNDVPGILAIYNEVIANTTAIYRDSPATEDDRLQWVRSRAAAGFPVLVAVSDDAILGFASFGEFRAWPCYKYTVEHSIHVRHDHRKTGIGGELLQALFPLAAGMGKHVMVAGVDASNAASIQFHQKHGFFEVAHFHEVGFKFGRWLDLVFLQKWLGPRTS